MQQGGDYSSAYYHQPHYYQNPNPIPNPNPNPNDLPPNLSPATYASAPPFSQYSSPSDLPTFPSSYPTYQQNPDPVPNLPPSAPSYTQPLPYQPYNPSESPYYPYDQPQSAPNYAPPNPIPNPNPNYSSFSSPAPAPAPAPVPAPAPAPYVSSYGHLGSSVPQPVYEKSYESRQQPAYENSYESNMKFDRGRSYLDENSGLFGRSGLRDDGAYAYDGGSAEPYGARGTSGAAAAKSSIWSGFDDYGRSTSFSSSSVKEQVGSGKIVKAIPKAEAQQDVKSGVQKFRVKILPEGGGNQTPLDVLCQIGLDGIRMLDPSNNRTLRIYPLETVTRWEVTDGSIYTFWSKSSVDIDPRRIRLQSNSYTTNTILDIVTAATVQLKEMGGKDSFAGRSRGNFDAGNQSEQPTEKKKGFVDWMNLIKPGNEEKDHWVPDEAVTKCNACAADFGAFVRKHHCRNCGDIFCDKCTQGRIALNADEQAQPVRVCDRCMAEVSHRLSNAKEATSKSAVQKTHEDLARKLQEEMDKNRKASSGSRSSDGTGKRMREVACPTCTVHLQVQVPSSGSETIECGVCQHPFLVSAH